MRARILHLLPALLSIETGVLLLIFFFRKWGYFNFTFDGFLSLLQFRSASGFDFATGWDDRAYGGSYPDWKAIYSLFYLPIAGILLTSAGMLYARGIVTHQRVYKTWIISGLFGIFAILVQHLEAQQQLASYSRNFLVLTD